MSEHTPGPWESAHRLALGRPGRCVVAETPDHKILAPSPYPNWIGQSETDARLIAAAPDLLAALAGVLSSRELEDEGITPGCCAACDEWIAARSAIAKALGKNAPATAEPPHREAAP